MSIERITTSLGLSILGQGTKNWGDLTNQNIDLVDVAISTDRTRITALENISAVLPLAIANRIGHNLLRNNVFSQGAVTAPERPTFWTTQFLNGAVGNYTRTTQTLLVGTHSFRVSIVNTDTSPSAQTRPYPGLNILDPESNTTIASSDPRQLINGFGYSFQAVTLFPKTRYTLSSYGKAEIPNASLGINVHWKVGVVFKTATNTVIHSYFTIPQINRTNNVATESFKRVELTFTTPDLPVVQAEIWLVAEGSIPAGIGSSWFDGIQLEQATRATALDAFSMQGSNLFVDGDLIIAGNLRLQQPELFFESNQVTFTGNVQIGDNINEDVLSVYAKASTFYGPLTVQGNVVLGDNPISDKVDVVANITTFFDDQNNSNPQGGHVKIQGNLNVDGNVVLGTSATLNTVTFNAQLVNAGNNLAIVNNLTVGGTMDVERATNIGSNQLGDALTVLMSDQGSYFEGAVTLRDDLEVRGNTTLGDNILDSVIINAGTTTLNALHAQGAMQVDGPATFNIGSAPTDNFTVVANDLTLIASGNATLDTILLDISGSLSLGSGNIAIINDTDTTFGLNTSPLSSFEVFAVDSSFSGGLDVGADVNIGGDLFADGDNFIFGSAFSATPAGTITVGNSSALTASQYDNTLYVYAGNTFFGDLGTQKKGNVEIGGNLSAAGNVSLGSSTSEDLVTIKANQLTVELGSGLLNIGGGFANVPYNPNPLVSDKGGITIDNNGNLSMNGKLTVRGPFDPTEVAITPLLLNSSSAITIQPTASAVTFSVSSDGYIAGKGLSLNNGFAANINANTASLGSAPSPLQSFSVFSPSSSFSGALNVDGSLTSGPLTSGAATIDGNLVINGNTTLRDNFVGNGTSFTFGAAPSLNTTFDVRAQEIKLGIDGSNIGNVTIGHNLVVRNNLDIGFPSQYENVINANAYSINLDVASNRLGITDLAGFRVGGGFKNNAYNSLLLDHGGVTIDAYRNIFADGKVVSKGPVAFESLELIVSLGVDPENPLFTIIDASDGYSSNLNFSIDGYGNIESTGCIHAKCAELDESVKVDGYMILQGTNLINAPLGSGLGIAGAGQSNTVFQINRVDTTVTYSEYTYGATTYLTAARLALDIDDLGNVRTTGFLHTTAPGKSNLSAYSVTVGDGVRTFGDFNSTGPIGASLSPIQDAINFIASRSLAGIVFIKSGEYNLPSPGLILPDNISLVGEGPSTLLNGSVVYGLAELGGPFYGQIALGVTLGINSQVKNLNIFNCNIGISAPLASSKCTISNATITGCSTAIKIAGNKNWVKFANIVDCTNGVDISGDKNIVTENFLTVTGTDIINTGLFNVTTSNIA